MSSSLEWATWLIQAYAIQQQQRENTVSQKINYNIANTKFRISRYCKMAKSEQAVS